MAMLRINATARGLRVHGSPQSVNATLAQAASRRGPVTIMVHGYKYSPFVAGHCPHQLIFCLDGWPSQLQTNCDDGLCIAFGWHARGGLVAAYNTALGQANQLAQLIARLRGRRPVHIIAHSLGATLTLSALPYLQAGDLGRIVLLSGAAHLGLANHALTTSAGARCEMFHVTSSSNALFDFVFERMIQGSGAIGRGLEHRNAITLQIDCPNTLAQLATLGYPVATAQRRICHWSGYTRMGVMALNAALLGGALDLDTLRHALPTVRPLASTDKASMIEDESLGEGLQHEQLH